VLNGSVLYVCVVQLPVLHRMRELKKKKLLLHTIRVSDSNNCMSSKRLVEIINDRVISRVLAIIRISTSSSPAHGLYVRRAQLVYYSQ